MLFWVGIVGVITRRVARETNPKARIAGYGSLNRVATNLENLEYSGISLNMENSGNSQGILGNLREKL